MDKLPVILSTLDYGMFKRCKHNREVSEAHVKDTVSALKKSNLLHLHPILVDGEMQIISGQHRFEAAKRLKVPVYYIKDEAIPEDCVLTINNLQKKSSSGDCVQYYAEKNKNEDYIYLNNLRKRLDLSTRPLLYLLFACGSRENYNKIKNGDFTFKDLNKKVVEEIAEAYLEFTDWCKANKLKPFEMYRNQYFCGAFRHFFLADPDMKRFKDKILNYWQQWRRQATTADYRSMMFDIYNKGIRNHFLKDPFKDTEEDT